MFGKYYFFFMTGEKPICPMNENSDRHIATNNFLNSHNTLEFLQLCLDQSCCL